MDTSFWSHLTDLLPKIRTRLQLSGLVITVGAFVAVRTIAPNAIKAQISAGAIGVAFVVFGQVFQVLKDFPEKDRAKVVITLFVVFCFFVLFLVGLTSVLVIKATEPVSWLTFLATTRKESDGTFRDLSCIGPSRGISTPMTLEFEFAEEIIGEPIIEQQSGNSPRPVSYSVVRHIDRTFTVTISDPPLERDVLYVVETASKSSSNGLVRVTCLDCPPPLQE